MGCITLEYFVSLAPSLHKCLYIVRYDFLNKVEYKFVFDIILTYGNGG